MQNFSQATAATSTALNSTGSAMQENSRHMESLEAKTNQLKETFQELANNVIDNELIKSLLSFANGALKVADTSIGRFIIQTTLLTGALGGLGSLLSFYVPALTQFGTTFKTLGTIISGTSTVALTFGTALKTAFPIAAVASTILVGLYTGVKLLKNAFADTTPTMSDTVASLKENLETTKETTAKVDDLINSYKELASKEQKSAEDKFKLAGIQSQLNETISIYGERLDLTSGSIEENTKKIKENTLAYLNNQLVVNADKYKTAKQWQPDYTLGGSTTKEEQDIEQKILMKYPTEAAKWSTELFKQFLTELYAALPDVNSAFGKEILEAFQNVEKGAYEAQTAVSEYETILSEVAKNTSLEEFLNKATMSYGIARDEAVEFYNSVTKESQNVTNGNAMYFQSLEELSDAIKKHNEEIDNAQSALKTLSNAQEEYNTNNSLSIDTVQQLLSLDSEYINALIDENGQINLSSEAIKNLIKDKNSYITALATETLGTYVSTRAQELLEQQNKKVGETAEEVTPTLNDLGKAALESGTKALEGSAYWNAYWEGIRGAGTSMGLDEANTEQLISDAKNFASSLQGILSGMGSKVPSWTGKTTSAKTTSDILADLKKQLEVVDHEMFLLEKKNTEEADKKRIAMATATQEKIHNKAEGLRKKDAIKYAAEIRELSKLWWQYEDDVSSALDAIEKRQEKSRKTIEDSVKKQLQDMADEWNKQAEKLSSQKDAMEALSSLVQDYADEQIAAINKEIEALETENNAIEDQISLEEKLQALAKAKTIKQMVFKDGRFQYVEDVDAVSKAQADLDAYNREKNLQDKKNALEAEKETLEEYKKQWADLGKTYEKEQNKLLIFEQLGIDIEQENWNDRLENAQIFVDQYTELMEKLAEAQKKASEYQEASSSISSEKTIADYKADYEKAQAAGDTAGMEAAHAGAEAIRESQGFSGGIAGDEYIPIPKHANGTLSANSGLSIVGEQGPEMRVLNQGDGILPAGITKNLWGWGSINPKNFLGQMNQGLSFNNVNMSFPSVRNGADAESFVTGLKNLAYQRAFQRT